MISPVAFRVVLFDDLPKTVEEEQSPDQIVLEANGLLDMGEANLYLQDIAKRLAEELDYSCWVVVQEADFDSATMAFTPFRTVWNGNDL